MKMRAKKELLKEKKNGAPFQSPNNLEDINW